MREQIVQRMEVADSLFRQFGLHKFDDDWNSWWPESMRVERDNARHQANQRNGGYRAKKV